jgi:hypothetical protein
LITVRSSATSEWPRSIRCEGTFGFAHTGIAAEHHADAAHVEGGGVLGAVAGANSLSMQSVAIFTKSIVIIGVRKSGSFTSRRDPHHGIGCRGDEIAGKDETRNMPFFTILLKNLCLILGCESVLR